MLIQAFGKGFMPLAQLRVGLASSGPRTYASFSVFCNYHINIYLLGFLIVRIL